MPVTTNTRKLAALLGASGAGIGTDGTLQTAAIKDGAVTAVKVAADMATQAELDAVSTTANTDTTNVRQDLNIVALREAVTENRVALNLPNSFIDQFQDDSGIQSETLGNRNAATEYWSSFVPGNTATATTNLILHFDNNTNDSSSTTQNPTDTSNAPGFVTGIKKFGTHSAYFDGSKYILFNQGDGGTWFGSGDWAVDFWWKADADSTSYRSFYGHQGQDSSNYHQLNYNSTTNYLHTYNDVLDTTNYPVRNASAVMADFHHILIQRYNNTLKIWVDGVLAAPTGGLSLSKNFNTTNDFGVGWDGVNTKALGHMDEFRLCKHAPTITSGDLCYTGNDTGNFTAPTVPYALDVTNATAELFGIASVPSAAKTKVSGVMLYKDAYGTASPGTQLKIYFTCNGGTNWTEAASYTAVTPVFSTGIKMVKLGETTCTSGSDIRYKAVWASQVASSLETQLHGIGLNY